MLGPFISFNDGNLAVQDRHRRIDGCLNSANQLATEGIVLKSAPLSKTLKLQSPTADSMPSGKSSPGQYRMCHWLGFHAMVCGRQDDCIFHKNL